MPIRFQRNARGTTVRREVLGVDVEEAETPDQARVGADAVARAVVTTDRARRRRGSVVTACVRETRSHQSTSSHREELLVERQHRLRAGPRLPRSAASCRRGSHRRPRPSSDRLRPSSASRCVGHGRSPPAPARARLERSSRRSVVYRSSSSRNVTASPRAASIPVFRAGRPARRSPARRITRTRGSLGTSTGSGLASSTTRHSKLVTVCASTDRTASARYWGRPYVGTITVNFGGCTQLSNASRQYLASRRPATPASAVGGPCWWPGPASIR